MEGEVWTNHGWSGPCLVAGVIVETGKDELFMEGEFGVMVVLGEVVLPKVLPHYSGDRHALFLIRHDNQRDRRLMHITTTWSRYTMRGVGILCVCVCGYDN